MAEPTQKSHEINNLLNSITGRDREETIRAEKCTTCGVAIGSFRDALSKEEYRISGMCQSCQDGVFGV